MNVTEAIAVCGRREVAAGELREALEVIGASLAERAPVANRAAVVALDLSGLAVLAGVETAIGPVRTYAAVAQYSDWRSAVDIRWLAGRPGLRPAVAASEVVIAVAVIRTGAAVSALLADLDLAADPDRPVKVLAAFATDAGVAKATAKAPQVTVTRAAGLVIDEDGRLDPPVDQLDQPSPGRWAR